MLMVNFSWTNRGIFNLGAVLGSAIELGLTYNSGKENTVSNTVYSVFMILSFLGALIPILLVNPTDMIRSDGSQVLVTCNPSWKSELRGMWKILRVNYWIVVSLRVIFFISTLLAGDDFVDPSLSISQECRSFLMNFY